MLVAEATVLFVSDPLGVLFLVFGSCVVTAFALAARQCNVVSHRSSLSSLARRLLDDGSSRALVNGCVQSFVRCVTG
jgi:hypothetical protein